MKDNGKTRLHPVCVQMKVLRTLVMNKEERLLNNFPDVFQAIVIKKGDFVEVLSKFSPWGFSSEGIVKI